LHIETDEGRRAQRPAAPGTHAKNLELARRTPRAAEAKARIPQPWAPLRAKPRRPIRQESPYAATSPMLPRSQTLHRSFWPPTWGWRRSATASGWGRWRRLGSCRCAQRVG